MTTTNETSTKPKQVPDFYIFENALRSAPGRFAPVNTDLTKVQG